jgi:4-amino-4-deoxy-L-arabinose transferase-like glycosyltransferase
VSLLKPDQSIVGTLAVMTATYALYSNGLPSIADIRTAKPGNKDIDAAERSAAWMAAGVVAGVSILAKDPTIFILGGATVIGLSWWYRHANMVNPEIGKAIATFTGPTNITEAAAQEDANTYDMGAYETSA